VANIVQANYFPGLTLWRTPGPPVLLSLIRRPPRPGELLRPFRTRVFACSTHALTLTAHAVSRGAHVVFQVGQLRGAVVDLPVGKRVTVWALGAGGSGADNVCKYAIAPEGTVEVDRVGIAKASDVAPPHGVALHRLGKDVTELAVNGGVSETAVSPSSEQVSHFGYCLDGVFIELSPNQPALDPRYKNAVPANYIAGQGITCSAPPPGYVRDGFATADLGVPPGIYPYYHAP
jgi:hypothetical protein